MSFPRYPKYKDSGVEWLGQVPEHWAVLRLRRILREPLQYGANESADCEDRDLPRFVRITDIDERGKLRDETFKSLPESDAGPFLLAAGDVLLARSGATVGKSFLYSPEWGRACFAGYLIRARLDEDVCLALWFWYVCRSAAYWAHVSGSQIQATIQNVSAERYGELPVLLPPAGEQPAIVTFLDRETAKIGALVAEQERLIALLKEKRQAVISHAVTKGLNPDAPMKDSGVEWLGQVPAHWEVMPLKWVISSMEQGWSPQCEGFPAETDDEWGVLKVGCVNGGVFNKLENKVLPADLEPVPSYALAQDDLLISRANTRELVGGAAVVERAYPRLMLCDKLYRLRFDRDRVDPWFVCLYLGADAARGQIELSATGASASMVNISQSAIRDLLIPLPELTEQRRIVADVRRNTSGIERLIAEAESAITLLQERRTALISAAVTGQIDVRGTDGRTPA